jgi:hypothetical protein
MKCFVEGIECNNPQEAIILVKRFYKRYNKTRTIEAYFIDDDGCKVTIYRNEATKSAIVDNKTIDMFGE